MTHTARGPVGGWKPSREKEERQGRGERRRTWFHGTREPRVENLLGYNDLVLDRYG